MRNSEKRIDMLPEKLCKQCVNIYFYHINKTRRKCENEVDKCDCK